MLYLRFKGLISRFENIYFRFKGLVDLLNHEYERLRANVIPPFWNVVYLGNSPSKRK